MTEHSSNPKISVIVTTYNKERELELVLEGFRHQTLKDFEIIVADDGSGDATRKVIDEARQRADHPIIHSWQEDDGFRAARSRNLAIAKAKGDLIVMVDGDCIPLPNFLATQLKDHRPNTYLAGERFFLTEQQAAEIQYQAIVEGSADYLQSLVPPSEQKRIRKIRRKNKVYRALKLKVRPKVITANFAASRADLNRINGFDERYVGWGHEDTDLGRRLRNIGVKSANELAHGEVLHLWHKTESSFAGRVRDCPNADYFNRGFVLSKCRKGLQDRPYSDLNINLTAPPEHQSLATEILCPKGPSHDPEVWILLDSNQHFPKDVEVPTLVLTDSAPTPSRSLLKKTALLLSQKLSKEQLGYKGEFIKLENQGLGQNALEEIRDSLDHTL